MTISRYSSLCVALQMMEAVQSALPTGKESRMEMEEHIRNVREITRDVRYGGQWSGDCESVAQALECCRECRCTMCAYYQYRKDQQRCTVIMMGDAAKAIRYLAAELKKTEEIQ